MAQILIEGASIVDITRRSFLRNASVGVAAAGAVAAAPGLLGLGGSAVASDASIVASDASIVASDASTLEGPIVAHVLDASKGTVAVFHGVREVIVESPSLARALAAALR